MNRRPQQRTPRPEPVGPGRLRQHLEHLCDGIGVRLAGTAAERAAAEYCLAEFAAAGAAASIEEFEVMSRVVTRETLEVRIGGSWRSFPCSLFSNTPGTGGVPVEAPLVFHEAPAVRPDADLGGLRGKAVVHLGCHIESREAYRRLMAAGPAFLLFVDVRYPGSVPLADGMFPAYTRALGARPTVNVAYQDAWEWLARGADRARLTVAGGMQPGRSGNVVAELAGDGDDPELLYLGAHHDTQAGSVGADDNASGVAGLLELARVLAPLPRRRAIRLVSFGAEEQLSVGSADHVRAHRAELARRGRLIFNLDSYGSHLGWTELFVNGPDALRAAVDACFARHGLPLKVTTAVLPYADHFPFVAAGVPGMTLIRSNCTAGRFFHHRPDDDLTRVSPALMAAHLDAVAAWLADLAAREHLPFDPAMPPAQAGEIERIWTDLFGGWDPTGSPS